jgi:RNA polymerase sigma factor (sigma-70 family)
MGVGLAHDRRNEEDRRIEETIQREQSRLRNFIRMRVGDDEDTEDILQEVFYELVEAYRMMSPIEHAGAWLFRVARNRIIDRFRKKRPVPFSEAVRLAEGDLEEFAWEELLPSPDAGPEALYARNILLEELDAAIDELPEEQREVFVAHEMEGRSFKEISAMIGVNINTLLSRKRHAVLRLRRRLQAIYDEFRET